MALFGRKKTAVKNNVRKAHVPTTVSGALQGRNLSSVLLRPRVTEKSARHGEQSTHTFVVHPRASKYDVRDAVEQLFKVRPRKVTIVNRAPRTSHSSTRGRKVTVPGTKKANVFLKKGDRIDLI